MNTRIVYLHRDAENYKSFNEIIIEGVVIIENVIPYLYDKEFFLPEIFDWPQLNNDVPQFANHPWHAFDEFISTEDQPNSMLSSNSFVDLLKFAKEFDWDTLVYELKYSENPMPISGLLNIR